MSVDKLVDSTQLDSDLASVANAIRAKSGGNSQLEFPNGFVSEIGNIPSGGGGYTDDEVLTGAKPSGDVSFKATADISTRAISGRKNMTSLTIDLTDGYILKSYAIQANTNLKRLVLFNRATYVDTEYGSYSITENGNLTTLICRGQIKGTDQSGLRGNAKLKVFDLEYIQGAFGHNCFYGDTVLDTVILRQTSKLVQIASLSFTNSPFASGKTGGTIYIPKVLYDKLGDGTSLDYKSASNWSTYDGYGTITWAKLEGSIYESLNWWES